MTASEKNEKQRQDRMVTASENEKQRQDRTMTASENEKTTHCTSKDDKPFAQEESSFPLSRNFLFLLTTMLFLDQLLLVTLSLAS